MTSKGFKEMQIGTIIRYTTYNATIVITGAKKDGKKTQLWSQTWSGWTDGSSSSPKLNISEYEYIEFYLSFMASNDRHLIIRDIIFS